MHSSVGEKWKVTGMELVLVMLLFGVDFILDFGSSIIESEAVSTC